MNILQANRGKYHQDHRKACENDFGEEVKLILLQIKIRDSKIEGVYFSGGTLPSLDDELEGEVEKKKVEMIFSNIFS